MHIAALALIGITALGALQGDGIIRLKPSDFKQLPAPVRRDLDRRGCRIPQAPWKPAPHNVIVGAFISARSQDWAVVCSIKAQSRVLVYRGGKTSRVDSLSRMPDVAGDERVIDIASAKHIQEQWKAYGGTKPPPLDHEGIDDGSERGSVIRYYWRSRWMELTGSN